MFQDYSELLDNFTSLVLKTAEKLFCAKWKSHWLYYVNQWVPQDLDEHVSHMDIFRWEIKDSEIRNTYHAYLRKCIFENKRDHDKSCQVSFDNDKSTVNSRWAPSCFDVILSQ